LWATLKAERGIAGRDAIWHHPDLLPTGEDLDDPKGFSERRRLAEASDTEVDDALQKLLSGGYDTPGDAASEDEGSTDGSSTDGSSPDEAGPDSGNAGPQSPSN
jgi:hypothetical protein